MAKQNFNSQTFDYAPSEIIIRLKTLVIGTIYSCSAINYYLFCKYWFYFCHKVKTCGDRVLSNEIN